MSDEFGWIKLYRSIELQPWFKKPNTVQLFLHFLVNANRQEGYKVFYKGQEITLKAGEFWTTNEKIQEVTGLSVRCIRTACQHLKATNTLTNISSPQGTIFTIKNWINYQSSTNKTTNDRQTTDKRPTIEQEGKKERRKERTRRNSASSKCEICENGTGWVTKLDGVKLADCDCMDQKRN